MPSAGFESAIPAGERLQTHALDRSASGIGKDNSLGFPKPKISGNKEEVSLNEFLESADYMARVGSWCDKNCM
jgi:hypothetical protein